MLCLLWGCLKTIKSNIKTRHEHIQEDAAKIVHYVSGNSHLIRIPKYTKLYSLPLIEKFHKNYSIWDLLLFSPDGNSYYPFIHFDAFSGIGVEKQNLLRTKKHTLCCEVITTGDGASIKYLINPEDPIESHSFEILKFQLASNRDTIETLNAFKDGACHLIEADPLQYLSMPRNANDVERKKQL